MGRDKARIVLGGVPMAVRVALAFRQAGHPVALIRRGPLEEAWAFPDGAPLRVVAEPVQEGHHALLGVVTALDDAGGDCLLAPCDVPRLSPDDIRALVQAGPPAVAFDGRRVHPLVAYVPSTWRDRAARHAGEGASVRAFVQDATRVRCPAERLHNVNVAEDLSLWSRDDSEK